MSQIPPPTILISEVKYWTGNDPDAEFGKFSFIPGCGEYLDRVRFDQMSDPDKWVYFTVPDGCSAAYIHSGGERRDKGIDGEEKIEVKEGNFTRHR